MERITRDLIEPLLDKFYVSYLDISQYYKIPSMEGIRLFDGSEIDLMRKPYTVLYNKSRLLNIPKDFDEDNEFYTLKESIDIYPDFYIKNVEEMED